MKKILISSLILSMTTTLLISCGKQNNDVTNKNNNNIILENNDNIILENTDKSDNNSVNEEEKENDVIEESPAEVEEQDSNQESIDSDSINEEEQTNLSNEEIESYARELCQNYYDYTLDLNNSLEHDGIIFYYVEVNVGPPDELKKEMMIGTDGHLYKYDDIKNGVYEAVR